MTRLFSYHQSPEGNNPNPVPERTWFGFFRVRAKVQPFCRSARTEEALPVRGCSLIRRFQQFSENIYLNFHLTLLRVLSFPL